MENLIQSGEPQVMAYTETEDGYRVRALCLVDGRPAEYEAEVRTDKYYEHSTYAINVFGLPGSKPWTCVYSLTGTDTGRPPVAMNKSEDPDVLSWLNSLGTVVWNVARVVVEQARKRAEEIEVDMVVRRAGAENYAARQNAGLLTSPMSAAEDPAEVPFDKGGWFVDPAEPPVSDADLEDLRARLRGDGPTTGRMTVAMPEEFTPEPLPEADDLPLREDEYVDLNTRILEGRRLAEQQAREEEVGA